MVTKDKDYEEASFDFYIENPNFNVEGEEIEDEYIKVEKCGVHFNSLLPSRYFSTHSSTPLALELIVGLGKGHYSWSFNNTKEEEQR
ncbi:Histidine ammonia-lyase [Gossypium arboreum]|uniref:Histidine ammonia-lyase n=1 Tax=Gossypium arboreum TaxID=29729 RepID=A0A0B0N4W4_GOSAR|nr:Histidine ammonia-lyase [Gossypium arboreum]